MAWIATAFCPGRRVACLPAAGRQAGTSLVEVMLSMALGLSLVLAATSLFVALKGVHVAASEAALLDENGRHAIRQLVQAIRQAAYLDPASHESAGSDVLAALSPDVEGLDQQGQSSAPGLERSGTMAVNGSDVLALRFSGSGAAGAADGTVSDCSGRAIAAPVELETDRGWSIFFVANGVSGEPELYCKTPGRNDWTSQPLATGVESLQLLYGLDDDGDGLAERYMNARSVNDLDAADALAPAGGTDSPGLNLRNRKTHWKHVVSIRLALVVRARSGHDMTGELKPLYLFGPQYGLEHGGDDPGTTLDPTGMPPSQQRRLRKLFVLTVALQNRSLGEAT